MGIRLLEQPDTLTQIFVRGNFMSERMLSAIRDVEKGAHPVFPAMPFSMFPEFIKLLNQTLKARAEKNSDEQGREDV